MRGATIRRLILVALAVLAAASMFPSFGGSSHRPAPPPHHPRALVSKAKSPPAPMPAPSPQTP
jgi:hypothetical protein